MRISERVFKEKFGEKPNQGETHSLHLFSICFELMQRWEELTRGKWIKETFSDGSFNHRTSFQPALLKKSHFICEVEKPKNYDLQVGNYAESITEQNKCNEYTMQLKEVLFEKFETKSKSELRSKRDDVSIYFPYPLLLIQRKYEFRVDTISDLIFEIDRYNRTATTPIVINWTENIISKLND